VPDQGLGGNRGNQWQTQTVLGLPVGDLLGPAEHGGDRKSDQVPHAELDHDIPANRRSEFRKMAANPDIVEEVAAEGTDDNPPSSASKPGSATSPSSKPAAPTRWARLI
jgi:hypothetical protein